MPTWDEAQYLKFADQRTRPSHELLARVPLPDAPGSPRFVVDLGCGPGNSTALLQQRWPDARVLGVDNSPEMLARARRDYPDIEWEEADIGHWRAAQTPELIFANAALQWLPDHERLFPALFSQLDAGGVMAVQMPHSFDQPSHRAMREIEGPWSSLITSTRSFSPVSPAAFYYDLLAPQAAHVDLWQTTYEHVMPDAQAIVEWVKGTGLRPYLKALPDTLRKDYLAAYLAAIDHAYPPRSDGRRLFSFPRLFLVAVRR
ncbi:trans-aconitate 2-methyltransferase [Uliginosibacterium sp. H1]|uniref:trans-aconitate 2-methyltransferase n=1 Tax=Uliginosibacterium sp. H1 TaxID=3114757 RepID=UPI002E17A814|nr:trans-aconitate 2-methyltransferase [Uliginosibacterium sp. H1]